MSKKIIYLLSLLMALSLVFASCKKNAAGTGDLTPPPTDNETGKEDADQETGLFKEWDLIPKDTLIKEYEILRNNGTDFYRNPVVVSLGDGRVLLFAELRYKRAGAANDVGIDGDGAVDIIYKVSKNSGYDWDSQTYYVVKNSEKIEDAHGAPNVFLIGKDKIVVVASAGSGIGRTGKLMSEGRTPSKVDYAIGTIGTDGKITWNTQGWQELKINNSDTVLSKIQGVDAGGKYNEKFNQYGTVPGIGLVNNNTIYLSLVIANQGSTKTEADVRELMGRYVLKGTIGGDSITWTAVAEGPKAYTTKLNLGPWKETQLYAGTTDDNLKFFVVPSPWTDGTKNLKLGKSDNNTVPPQAINAIPASEGSAGYVDLNGKWFGINKYDPVQLTGTTSPQNRSIFLHVADTSKNLTMYVLDNSQNDFQVQGNGWLIDSVGKSSSVDVLPDGTIIYAAEQGGSEKNYKLFFYRYSQYFIATKTGNNK